MANDVLLIGSGRVWTIKHRAGPRNTPFYHHMGMAGAPDWGQGDVTRIEVPSDRQYNQWEEVSRFQVSPDRASITLTIYETPDRSEFMEILRIRCAVDVQIHLGLCEDPRDFDGGWQKVRILEDALPTGYSGGDHGALEGGNQGSITEEIPLSARGIYDVLRMNFSRAATAAVGEEVVAVMVADNISCGECEDTPGSDGCQRILAVTNSPGSSPGLLPQVILSTDQFGGSAIIERWVSSMALADGAVDAAVVGNYLVVLSNAGFAHHYADIGNIEMETETWTEVTGGYAGNGPNAIYNYSPLLSYIAGDNGTVYRMTSPTSAVSTLVSATSLVSDDLKDIDGFDMDRVMAVGDNGAVVYTLNGATWVEAENSPVGPTNLAAVAFRTKNEVWVGGDAGSAFYTQDWGRRWYEKELPGGLVEVTAIVWATETVGFIAGIDAVGHAKILRTINGGFSFYVMPEASGQSIPQVDRINSLAVCEKEANKLFAGGLDDDATTGVLLVGSD